MTTAEVLVKCLEAQGVKYVFGIPGEENLAFLEALRTSSITLVITRHEQAAVFMAATFGRLTGKAGVALSTLGPGATNLVTGVAYAQLGGMPLLVITGQKPVRKSKQGRFQIIDVISMMKPLTKITARIDDPSSSAELVRKAFEVAETERPGAVHLELPEDIASEEVVGDVDCRANIKPYREAPSKESILKASELIQNAKHPVVLIAAGANRKRIHRELSSFIEKTKIPFVTTQMGKGVLDEMFPSYLGTTALSADDYVHCALERSDLILCIGHDTVEKPPVIMIPSKREVIHMNFYPTSKEEILDDVYVPSHQVVGDIALGLKELTEEISPQDSWDIQYFNRVAEKMRKQITEKSDSSSFPLKPQRIVSDLQIVLGGSEFGILCLDNGMYKLWIARGFFAREQNSVLLDNALATMGAGLPSAIAAKMLNPDKKVLAVVGDGGFMMSSSELETAKRLNLDLVVLVLNDNGYGMIKWKQEADGLTNFGLDFNNPDFVKFAESFGAKGVRIKEAGELKSALVSAFAEGGVHVIDCPIDYTENVLVFNKELKEKTCDL